MSKFFGLKPNSKTQKAADDFESKVMIRRNNRMLISTIYADIMQDEWAVALGYNQTREPGLFGRENVFEVRYSFQPEGGAMVRRLDTESGSDEVIEPGTFNKPDDFVIWALGQEKDIQLRNA